MIHLKIYIYLLVYWISRTTALTIKEEPDNTATPPQETSSYRLSVAKSQEPDNRVPTHLQRIRNGFSYEDADDVIHVIEPPKHFQELKILMQNGQKPLRTFRRDQSSQTRGVKPQATITAEKNVKSFRPYDKTFELDMELQETEQLPVQILASVRKTENYLRKFKPKLPLAQQRIKTKKIQTVVWEKSQERQQYAQGQEKKVNGMREFKNNQNRRKFMGKKRIKRQTSLAYHPLKGEELLEHINELVKNASIYLDAIETYEGSDDHIITALETTTLQGEILPRTSLRSTSIHNRITDEAIIKILENSVNATDALMDHFTSKSNFTNKIKKCSHIRGTDSSHIQTLRQQLSCMETVIKTINETKTKEQEKIVQQRSPFVPEEKGYSNKRNYEEELEHEDNRKATERQEDYGNDNDREYNNNKQQGENSHNNNKKYGERLDDERQSKDLRQKPFLVASLADDYYEDSSPSPLNTSLIYDDVMTTIRNLLQAKNLQNLEDSTSSSSSSSSASSSSSSPTTSSESYSQWEDVTLAQDNSQEPVDFHNLQQYLNSLQTIVANLPQISNSTLNIQEVEGKSSKYYFINPLGGIYNLPQPFHAQHQQQLPSPATIFRKFPDIPAISAYLGNGSLQTPSQNVIEIL